MRGTLPDSAKKTIFIVDDDPVSREVLATVLTMHGYAVESVSNGKAALAALKGMASGPDVILTDLRMDGLGGAELIAALRTRTKAQIVAMSASLPRAGEAAAADGFLLKPFMPRELEELLAEIPRDPDVEQGTEQDAEDPVLDTEILRQFRTIMPEYAVRQIYGTGLEDMGTRLDEIAAVIARGDHGDRDQDKLRRIGHALKGSCGMIGARQAAQLAAQIEEGSEAVTILAYLRNALENLKNRVAVEVGDCTRAGSLR
jgi:CheY-like chemotaxis protein